MRPIRALLLLLLLPAVPARGEMRSDRWYEVSAQGIKVGWLHMTQEAAEEEGRKVLVSREQARIEMRRFGSSIVVETSHAFWETGDFRPIRFETRSRMSEVETWVDGVVRPDGLHLTTRSLGPPSTSVIPWDPEVLFPAGADDLARRKGWAAGTTYSYRTFSPDLNALDRITIRVVGPETIGLRDGPRTLTRIVSSQELLGGQETIVWLDEAGTEVRIEAPVLEFRFDQVTREEALREREAAEQPLPDLALDTVIEANREIPNPRKVTRATYRFRLEGGDFEGLGLEGPGQTVRAEPDGARIVEVKSVAGPDRGEARRPPPPSVLPFLEDSPYIQFSDPKVRVMASEATAGRKTPWEKAKAVEKWVATRIRDKNMDVGFATAAEVARNLEGDCTEHAVLAAALLRANGIPSRLAVGLLYFDGKFGYHMWTEAWVGDWIPLDPTIAGPSVDATHIRLAESAMGNASPMASFATLNRLMGRLQIEVLEWETGGGRRGAPGDR